jgi:tight adherence protein C
MTFILALMGILLVAATVLLVVHAVALPRTRMNVHLREIEQYGFGNAGHDDALTPVPDVRRAPLNPLAEALGRSVARLIPSLPRLERGDLSAAGLYRSSPDAVHGFRALASVLLLVLVLWSGVSLSLTSILLVVGAPVIGWELPAVIIRQRGRRRLDAIDRELPHVIDVLIATIEAGMGFAASLQLISSRFEGPMGAELKLMQREQALGISPEQALENLVARCDSASVRAFSRSLLHGQELGVSIGPILRNLAIDIRNRRRQAAHEKVRKAPIKMLFPLALLIFPPLLIVILYPAIYSILHALSST